MSSFAAFPFRLLSDESPTFVATRRTLPFNVFGHVTHPLNSSLGARLKPKCLNTSNKDAVT